jgi:hypothetical protein
MVPDLLWKQGNLYNPKSDEVSLNLSPNLPEHAILIDEIPGFAKGKESDIGSMLLEEVEGSDLNEDQKEDLLNLVSLYQDFSIEGIEGLPQTPLLEFRVELKLLSSDSEALCCRACFRRDNEKTHLTVCRCWILHSGNLSIYFSCFCRGETLEKRRHKAGKTKGIFHQKLDSF